jgi:hypothetical protein
MNESQIYSAFNARDVAPLALDSVEGYEKLQRLGIGLDNKTVNQMMASVGMDSLQALTTTASIGTPIQFLQSWLPGFVKVLTAARKIDTLVGIATVGKWSDEEVVQGVLEYTGKTMVYGDTTNVPLASWNTNFERRTVVRFEEGLQVGRLEEARAGQINLNSAASKREAASLALEIQRNAVGFYGFNSGNGRTYGFLNDPSLGGYVTVAATGAGSTTTWSTKTFLNITADIRTAVAALRAQSQDTIDPETMELTLAVATAAVDRLSVTSDFGNSVRQWITETYPKMRIVSAPELSAANGGANVFYLYAERVNDQSTDDGRTFIQPVPSKFQVLGVHQTAKNYVEDYLNATAGVMCKRPFAVTRYTGI